MEPLQRSQSEGNWLSSSIDATNSITRRPSEILAGARLSEGYHHRAEEPQSIPAQEVNPYQRDDETEYRRQASDHSDEMLAASHASQFHVSHHSQNAADEYGFRSAPALQRGAGGGYAMLHGAGAGGYPYSDVSASTAPSGSNTSRSINSEYGLGEPNRYTTMRNHESPNIRRRGESGYSSSTHEHPRRHHHSQTASNKTSSSHPPSGQTTARPHSPSLRHAYYALAATANGSGSPASATLQQGYASSGGGYAQRSLAATSPTNSYTRRKIDQPAHNSIQLPSLVEEKRARRGRSASPTTSYRRPQSTNNSMLIQQQPNGALSRRSSAYGSQYTVRSISGVNRRGSQSNSSPTFSNKLQALMVVRDRMELLAATHRQEEAALRDMLQQLLHREGVDAPLGQPLVEDIKGIAAADVTKSSSSTLQGKSPDAALTLQEENVNLKKQLSEYTKKHADEQQKLVTAINERNSAIQLLETFQKEGSRVIESLHASVTKANQENVRMLQQTEALTQENNRLRDLMKRASSAAETKAERETGINKDSTSLPNNESPTSNDSGSTAVARSPRPPLAPPGPSTHVTVEVHEEAIRSYQDLLSEADEMITDLRVGNEELLRKIHTLEARIESYQQEQGGDSVADGDTPSSPAPTKMEAILMKELRAEKQQRLEAEEHAHDLVVQHQRHAGLLEQRLAHLTKLLYGGPNNLANQGGSSSRALTSISSSSSPSPSIAPYRVPINGKEGNPNGSHTNSTLTTLSLSGVQRGGGEGLPSTSRTDASMRSELCPSSPDRTPRPPVNWEFMYNNDTQGPVGLNETSNLLLRNSRASPSNQSVEGSRLDTRTPMTDTTAESQFPIMRPSGGGPAQWGEGVESNSHLLSARTNDGSQAASYGFTAASSPRPINGNEDSVRSGGGSGSDAEGQTMHQLSPFQKRRLMRDQSLAKAGYNGNLHHYSNSFSPSQLEEMAAGAGNGADGPTTDTTGTGAPDSSIVAEAYSPLHLDSTTECPTTQDTETDYEKEVALLRETHKHCVTQPAHTVEDLGGEDEPAEGLFDPSELADIATDVTPRIKEIEQSKDEVHSSTTGAYHKKDPANYDDGDDLQHSEEGATEAINEDELADIAADLIS